MKKAIFLGLSLFTSLQLNAIGGLQRFKNVGRAFTNFLAKNNRKASTYRLYKKDLDLRGRLTLKKLKEKATCQAEKLETAYPEKHTDTLKELTAQVKSDDVNKATNAALKIAVLFAKAKKNNFA